LPFDLLVFPLHCFLFASARRFVIIGRTDFPEVPVFLIPCHAKRARRSTSQVDVRIADAGRAMWLPPDGPVG
jgi:hypothetical protein